MARENQAPEPQDSSQPAATKGRFKPIIIVALLMLVEGVAIFALMSMITAPPEASVAAEDDGTAQDLLHLADEAEVELCEVDAFNRKEGRLYVYHIQLSALVAVQDVETINRFVEVRSASISDRVQVVIRAADPQHLNDPSLETIKRQIKFELNNLLGSEELIRDILVAKLLQSRSNL